MDKTWRNNAISLAGIFHAADLVEQIAKTGYLNTEDFETCVKSLLNLSPDSTEGVYGSVRNIRRGLEVLARALQNREQPKNADVIRYSLAILHLEKLLGKRPRVSQQIGEKLALAQTQAEHFSATHDNVIANLASVYTETISKFPYRIQVTGEQNYLEQPRVANQVRVMLFSGIRSATLWRQAGGRRWQFMFNRKKILKATEELLEETAMS